MLTDQLDKIRFGGDETPIKRLSVRGLLPDTEHYMTYEVKKVSFLYEKKVSHPSALNTGLYNIACMSRDSYVDSAK